MLVHWATSFCFSFASPYMIDSIAGNSFLIFMGFDIVAAVFCWFFVQETRGKNLEAAAGTAWEIAERNAGKSDGGSESEKGESFERRGSALLHQAGKEGVLVDEARGKEVEVVAVHDTFGDGLHHRK